MQGWVGREEDASTEWAGWEMDKRDNWRRENGRVGQVYEVIFIPN